MIVAVEAALALRVTGEVTFDPLRGEVTVVVTVLANADIQLITITRTRKRVFLYAAKTEYS